MLLLVANYITPRHVTCECGSWRSPSPTAVIERHVCVLVYVGVDKCRDGDVFCGHLDCSQRNVVAVVTNPMRPPPGHSIRRCPVDPVELVIGPVGVLPACDLPQVRDDTFTRATSWNRTGICITLELGSVPHGKHGFIIVYETHGQC